MIQCIISGYTLARRMHIKIMTVVTSEEGVRERAGSQAQEDKGDLSGRFYFLHQMMKQW